MDVKMREKSRLIPRTLGGCWCQLLGEDAGGS